MATLTLPNKPSFLTRKIALGITPAHILVVGIMLLSVVLHFSNLEAIGDANTYYTAAVESMLQSWSNFFFVAAEPGGSVTIDKPPLGLWIEAAFAFVLGVEGWVVSLPNILAGVFSVPLLYHLVKKYMGDCSRIGFCVGAGGHAGCHRYRPQQHHGRDAGLHAAAGGLGFHRCNRNRQSPLAVPGRLHRRAGI